MKAFVIIQDFGDKDACLRLVGWLADLTSIPASMNQPGSVLLVCDPAQLGELFVALAGSESTDWIEYTVQFG